MGVYRFEGVIVREAGCWSVNNLIERGESCLSQALMRSRYDFIADVTIGVEGRLLPDGALEKMDVKGCLGLKLMSAM